MTIIPSVFFSICFVLVLNFYHVLFVCFNGKITDWINLSKKFFFVRLLMRASSVLFLPSFDSNFFIFMFFGHISL